MQQPRDKSKLVFYFQPFRERINGIQEQALRQFMCYRCCEDSWHQGLLANPHVMPDSVLEGERCAICDGLIVHPTLGVDLDVKDVL